MKRKDDLTETIESIGFGLRDDWDEKYVAPITPTVKAKSNRWHEVKDDPEAHGKDFDYRWMDGNVFMPTCEAAQEYVYFLFGEPMHYYSDLDGFYGIKIDEHARKRFIRKTDAVGLISEDEYVANMENEQLMRSGE